AAFQRRCGRFGTRVFNRAGVLGRRAAGREAAGERRVAEDACDVSRGWRAVVRAPCRSQERGASGCSTKYQEFLSVLVKRRCTFRPAITILLRARITAEPATPAPVRAELNSRRSGVGRSPSPPRGHSSIAQRSGAEGNRAAEQKGGKCGRVRRRGGEG